MEKNVKQIVEQVIKDVEVKNPGQSEFHQTIEEVLTSLIPVLEKNPAYVDAKNIRSFSRTRKTNNV